ncbi:unnamed protein product [Mycena citricolor]|uniref:DUF1753-domain-containing protein n=1 Tax=Mycena citricolor TaxID=2018698 RepID=A0AAD2K5F4_9AGAR|nr:unnamed protein product [Mycena citricolor]
MKLTLRSEYRPWPLSSFLGILDIKTGVVIATLCAIFNKVAGVYGLIALLTGAGGSFAQLSLYLYSVLGLVALAWGLGVVKQEDPRQTLYYAHLFCGDHILSTLWTAFFAMQWWWYIPHDGARQANSQAQADLIAIANLTEAVLTDGERTQAAQLIWNQEKGTSAVVILLAWLAKIYLAILIYSYALHLRQGTYHSLVMNRPRALSIRAGSVPLDVDLAQGDDDDVEDFYRLNTPTKPSHVHTSNGNSATNGRIH